MTRLAAPVHSGRCPGLCLMTITKYNEALKLSPATGSRPRKVKASTSGSIRGGSCSCVRGGEGTRNDTFGGSGGGCVLSVCSQSSLFVSNSQEWDEEWGRGHHQNILQGDSEEH